MSIREMIMQRIEALMLVGGFSEDELCQVAMTYANQLYAEALHLRFVTWRDTDAIKKDLFSQGDSNVR